MSGTHHSLFCCTLNDHSIYPTSRPCRVLIIPYAYPSTCSCRILIIPYLSARPCRVQIIPYPSACPVEFLSDSPLARPRHILIRPYPSARPRQIFIILYPLRPCRVLIITVTVSYHSISFRSPAGSHHNTVYPSAARVGLGLGAGILYI